MRRPEVVVVEAAGLADALISRAPRKRAVGFDVFDTLLRRRVEPEYIKDLVAREFARRLARSDAAADWTYLRHRRRLLEVRLGEEAVARGGDHEFRLRDMMKRWVDESAETVPAELAAALVRHELWLEELATYPMPGISELLHSLRALGKRLIFVSDIYLDIEDVRSLLRRHGLADAFHAGYCSSRDYRTKRSGRLFEDVLRRETLSPGELLFVGDNLHSDVLPAQHLGIDSVHLVDLGERKRRIRLRLLEQMSERSRFWRGALAAEIVAAGDGKVAFATAQGAAGVPPSHAGENVDYRLGTLLAPAFIAFTRWVQEQARERGLQRLFFLSREGLTFLRMHRALARANPELGRDLPHAAYLGVSRAATFLPSMRRLDWSELDRMWRQYSRQSLAQLLRNLNLPRDEFEPLARRCGFASLEEPIEDPHDHAAFQAFLGDDEVQRRFEQHRGEANRRFADYLTQKGFFGLQSVGLVDIGWKGSIQDNLVRAAGQGRDCPDVHGLYFGLAQHTGDEGPSSRKDGFIADVRRGDWTEQVVFKNGPVFEMFATARHGAVTGYRRMPSGRIRPAIALADVERRNMQTHFAPVFRGLNDYLSRYLRAEPLIAMRAEDVRPFILDQLRRYILYPTRGEATAFLRYSHVESFGVHTTSTYEFKGSWSQILLGGSPLAIPRRLLVALQRQFWAEAVLRRWGVPFANFVYDLLETRYAKRVLPP